MKKVYFSQGIKKITDKIDKKRLKGKVGIKVHFGEEGNETYLDPKIAKAVYEKVISLGFETSLVECNVLYRGSRTNRENHIKVAKKHGFNFAPIDILDGEMGEEDITLKVEKGRIKEAKIGRGIEKYDSLIVLSHFKGHIATGFGGAFKNLGMGLGSRAGKLHMHSDVSPKVDQEKCTACGVCVKNCDVGAIKMEDVAEINSQKCIGCAMCIAVCEFKAINVPWGGSTNKQLQEKIIDYSQAIIEYLNRNLTYINILKEITKDCDCVGKKMKPIVEDIGILISDDPVATDKASLDLVNQKSNGKFDKMISTDGEHKIDYAEKSNLGTKKYKILDI